MTRLQTRLLPGLAVAGLAVAVTATAQPFEVPPPQPAEPPVPPGIGSAARPQVSPGPPLAPAPPAPTRLPVPLAQPRPMRLPVPNTPHLKWDADFKAYQAKPGEPAAHFTFALTNMATTDVVVNRVTTSCGCTVARLPAQPWRLTPGAGGQIGVTVDLRGKWGTLQKMITVDTSDGFKVLRVQITIPSGTPQPSALMVDRMRNQQMALADRQAVFKNDCARCHAQPTTGKTGAALFQAACAICHESAHRATMVPDLRALTHATDRQFWKSWIISGKPGTLMPAFAVSEGGPLTDAQIDSLADYLTANLPPRTAVAPAPFPAPPALPPVPAGAAQ